MTSPDHGAVPALRHYRGKPEAAQAVIDLVRRTHDLEGDPHARRLAVDALENIAAPEALGESRRLRALGLGRR